MTASQCLKVGGPDRGLDSFNNLCVVGWARCNHSKWEQGDTCISATCHFQSGMMLGFATPQHLRTHEGLKIWGLQFYLVQKTNCEQGLKEDNTELMSPSMKKHLAW